MTMTMTTTSAAAAVGLVLSLPPADWLLRRRAAAVMAGADAARWLGPGLNVDIGCGLGHLAAWAAVHQPPSRWLGIDPHWRPLPAVVRRLEREAPGRVRFVRGSGERLPVTDGAADGVMIAFVLHHLAPAAQDAVLAEAVRALRPGGTLLLIEDTPETPAERRRTERSDRWLNGELRAEPHHYRPRASWRTCLAGHGFELAGERDLGWVPPDLGRVPHTAFAARRRAGK
jgi:SAM-dependent methyltransferase